MAATVYLVSVNSWDGQPPVAAFSDRDAALAWVNANDEDNIRFGVSALVVDEPSGVTVRVPVSMTMPPDHDAHG